MRRYTISGLEHFIRILAQKPELMALGSLSPLVHIAEEAKQASTKCGCNATQVYSKHKGQFENALTNLSNGDHLIVKRVLNVDQICYYVRDSMGAFKQKCI